MGTNLCVGATRLSKYYAGAGIIPYGTVGYPNGVQTPIPITGPLSLSNFYGAEYISNLIINGNFEFSIGVSEDATRFRFLGWTILKQVVRMNEISYISNSLTPFTTTALPPPAGGGTSPGDNVSYDTNLANNPSFSYKIIDTTNPLYMSLAVPGGTQKYVLELRNAATFAGVVTPSNPNLFGIMRGPILISEFTFTIGVGDTISFNWYGAKDPQGDMYAVFIYALKPSTYEEIVLVDAYGTNSGWRTVNRTITISDPIGQFKFVAIHGSYDQSGGCKVGAYLYLNDIKIT